MVTYSFLKNSKKFNFFKTDTSPPPLGVNNPWSPQTTLVVTFAPAWTGDTPRHDPLRIVRPGATQAPEETRRRRFLGCAHPGENSVVRADEGAVLHTDEGAVIRTDAAAVVRTGDGACQRCAPLVLVVGDHMCLGGPDKVEIIRTLERRPPWRW